MGGRRNTTMAVVVGAVVALTGWARAVPALAAGWHVHPSPTPPAYNDALLAVARLPSTSQFWAVGFGSGAHQATIGLIEHTTANAWTLSAKPTASLLDVSALSPTRAFAVGELTDASDVAHPALETWNGSSWTAGVARLPPGAVGGYLAGVRAFSSTHVVAVGQYETSATTFGPLVETWNGHAWHPARPPQPPGCPSGVLNSVAAVPGAARLFAVGTCFPPAALSHALMERFDGTAWSVVPAPAPYGSSLESVTPVSGHEVWAVGSRIPKASGAVSRTFVERWNGSTWATVPSPNDAPDVSGSPPPHPPTSGRSARISRRRS